MGTNIELAAGDGHRLSAYMAEPAARPRGGIIVIQEIFGVTRHIRDVADQYAAAGFLAIAPALFDRVEPGVDVPYDQVARGVGYMQAMHNDLVMLDLQAALDRLVQRLALNRGRRVGVGYGFRNINLIRAAWAYVVVGIEEGV